MKEGSQEGRKEGRRKGERDIRSSRKKSDRKDGSREGRKEEGRKGEKGYKKFTKEVKQKGRQSRGKEGRKEGSEGKEDCVVVLVVVVFFKGAVSGSSITFLPRAKLRTKQVFCEGRPPWTAGHAARASFCPATIKLRSQVRKFLKAGVITCRNDELRADIKSITVGNLWSL
ncbi:hypothetical protein Pcinc_043039 [Petrolisthes cinctipes]|uniref:Uncharacterized protein n=1 Tax=Petrolisthes cinctipes TaxID=88211 RepID=A0AAE1BIC0_PETCI|nr:hypothetical protein Pcinc_043039 [Petrolisthes cinctipes]